MHSPLEEKKVQCSHVPAVKRIFFFFSAPADHVTGVEIANSGASRWRFHPLPPFPPPVHSHGLRSMPTYYAKRISCGQYHEYTPCLFPISSSRMFSISEIWQHPSRRAAEKLGSKTIHRDCCPNYYIFVTLNHLRRGGASMRQIGPFLDTRGFDIFSFCRKWLLALAKENRLIKHHSYLLESFALRWPGIVGDNFRWSCCLPQMQSRSNLVRAGDATPNDVYHLQCGRIRLTRLLIQQLLPFTF